MEHVKCDICGKPGDRLATVLKYGQLPDILCKECIDLSRFPWSDLVSTVWTVGATKLEDIVEELHEGINNSLTFYSKTFQDLINAAKKLDDDYREYCNNHIDPNKDNY